MKVIELKIKTYIQPFEKLLALQEVRSLTGVTPTPLCTSGDNGIYQVRTTAETKYLASQLTYWESVKQAGKTLITTQSKREATTKQIKNKALLNDLKKTLPFTEEVDLPSRRCLRYGTHGLHEYRGKFFPQLVKSLINVAGIKQDAVIADPMSGSGTTVLETILSGRKGLGIDMNPLSVFIGRAKANLVSADPDILIADYEKVRVALTKQSKNKQNMNYFHTLPQKDQEYLTAWFSEEALLGLDQISQTIQDLENKHSKDLMKVTLSNIIRNISWQKNDDLRVRKEILNDKKVEPQQEFLAELEKSLRMVIAFLYKNGPVESNELKITEGDARKCADIWGNNSVDLIITSPPYATALPYLDTDRLSLCYLDLLPRPEHRARDQLMIGNREISKKLLNNYIEKFELSGNELPSGVQDVIRKIHDLNINTDAGFRRLNLPALLSKYFFDMTAVLQGMYKALKPGSHAFVVVGNNHTIAGGQRVDIETATFLNDIAKQVGFETKKSISMEMLTSRDIFKKNRTPSEEILSLKKPI